MGFICKYSKKEIGIQFGRILSLKEAKRWMRIKEKERINITLMHSLLWVKSNSSFRT
jgi:hypothetical protein